jgi:dihydrolipoamide dehydrogenase
MLGDMTEQTQKFDIAVLGSGPGGYPAAIKAAQHGAKVALIEAKELGGTCLNRGCIPSKTLIANAEVYDTIKNAEKYGITVQGVDFDYAQMVERKDQVVTQIRKGLTSLIAANGIHVFEGFGKFMTSNEIKITGKHNTVIYADKAIIATGSEPRLLPAFPVDGKVIHDSTSLLNLRTLPKSLIVIGGGVIGCEFASLYATLGVEVTILELLPRIIPTEAQVLSDVLSKSLKRRGVAIHTEVVVKGLKAVKNGVEAELSEGGTVFKAEAALVSVGRQVNSSNIGIENTGVELNDKGGIVVDDRMQTSVDGIYAIGDVTARWWLAHVATHQGIVAAENATGHPARVNYDAVPSVIFTHPEIASVGLSLEEAQKRGFQATAGAFPFQALGKSQAALHTEGFAQVIIDKKTGQVLGAQVFGHEASTMIGEMAVAVANELTVECLTETMHAHPTIAEAWMEAAFLASGWPLHLPPSKRKG